MSNNNNWKWLLAGVALAVCVYLAVRYITRPEPVKTIQAKIEVQDGKAKTEQDRQAATVTAARTESAAIIQHARKAHAPITVPSTDIYTMADTLVNYGK